jgi:hypothetical protein
LIDDLHHEPRQGVFGQGLLHHRFMSGVARSTVAKVIAMRHSPPGNEAMDR